MADARQPQKPGAWEPYAPTAGEPWDLRRVVHLHRRAGFAATWGEVQRDLKDGVYTGWGTSRHGDIESRVEIRNGRIISASIAQCLTMYSVYWIAALPPQVTKRQSPEVDVISGATESSNAFYDGIVNALKKAK